MGELDIRLIPVAPTGTECVDAIVCPGGVRAVERPVYPPSPIGRLIENLRIAHDVTMRELAKAAEIPPSALSDLEHGRATLSEQDWCALILRVTRVLRAVGAP